MLRRDDFISGVGVRVRKCFGLAAFCFSVPFEFKGVQHAVFFLNQVNLLLFVRSPKEQLREIAGIGIAFHPFDHHEIFPQCPGIVPQFQGSEVGQDGISHAVVVKVDFLSLFYLIPKVPAEGIQLEHDKTFL